VPTVTQTAWVLKQPPPRNPDDPAFDPQNELMDLIWLAFRGQDGQEARIRKASPELETLFIDLGFSPLVAGLISGAVVQYFVELLPKKRGRPWPRQRLIEAHAKRLEGIKQGLRASGEKGSVHKKAMQLLQAEYEQLCKALDLRGLPFRPFDYEALENYVRRAKRRSTK
jgi:hypothetical protein